MKPFPQIALLLGLISVSLVFPGTSEATELPRPDFSNTFYMTFHMPLNDPVYLAAQAELMSEYFSHKVYARIGVSTFANLTGKWSAADPAKHLEDEFDSVQAYLENCRNLELGLHVGYTFGFLRGVGAYNAAKQSDLRNCQWYNDGRLASPEQLTDETAALNTYIWLTPSRYALELRRMLQSNCLALGAFLARVDKDYPDTLIAASGPGEAELNFNRLGENSEEFILADYSPFAVMEFRDWITHQGLYDDRSGEFPRQGYQDGGAHYQGDEGLAQFNLEFGTEFSTWRLKYHDFDLEDSASSAIPWESLPPSGNLLPNESATGYILAGFDPPRAYDPNNPFWRLWERFRQEMVRNYVRDIAKWVVEGGFNHDRWYSHQIPADYLWGSSPGTDPVYARLISSASPLWTADNAPYGKMGVTCFDIRYPSGYKKTTDFLLPAMSQKGVDWAILEFDPFAVLPASNLPQENDVDAITTKYHEAYDAGVHLMALYKWEDVTGEHRTLGTPKIVGLQRFWRDIPDVPWGLPAAYPWTPPAVTGLTINESSGTLQLDWSEIIWHGLPFTWRQLPQFDNFAVYCREGNKEIRLLGNTRDLFLQISRPPIRAEYLVKARFQNESYSRNWEVVAYPATGVPFFPRKRIEVVVDPSRSIVYTGDFRVSADPNQFWRISASAPGLVLKPLSGHGEAWIQYSLDPAKLTKGTITILNVSLLDAKGNALDNLEVFVQNINQAPKLKNSPAR